MLTFLIRSNLKIVLFSEIYLKEKIESIGEYIIKSLNNSEHHFLAFFSSFLSSLSLISILALTLAFL